MPNELADELRRDIVELSEELKNYSGSKYRWLDRAITVIVALGSAFIAMQVKQASMLERIAANEHNIEMAIRGVDSNRQRIEDHVFKWHRGRMNAQ